MTHSNNLKTGFSFVEILLALAIASMILIPVLILQGTYLKQTNYYASALQALLYGESFCNQQELDALADSSQTTSTQKAVQTPPLTITYEKVPVPSGSSLRAITGLSLIKTTIIWDDLQGKEQQTLIRFTFDQHEEQP
jgi:Tfp pilus assembly protein PilV